MGSDESAPPLEDEVITELSATFNMSSDEIGALYSRWYGLAGEEKAIQEDDFFEASGLGPEAEEFVRRVFKIADKRGSGLNFPEFVDLVSILTGRMKDIDHRAAFVFRIYDENDQEFIDKECLTKVLRRALALKEIDNENLIRIAVDRTFENVDSDDDGRITLEDFVKEVHRNPGILNCVQIDEDKVLAAVE